MSLCGTSFDKLEFCSLVNVTDECRCDYVQQVSDCLLNSKLNYLTFPLCDLKSTSEQLGAAIVLLVWLSYLFASLAIVVEHRILPNLASISDHLKFSDVVAGVTLLALGNGTADIFTAVASVGASKNGGALAISGLLGSALFLVTVNTSIIVYFFSPKVENAAITRDVAVFFVGCLLLVYSLKTEGLSWEPFIYLSLYGCYVIYIVKDSRQKAQWYDTAVKCEHVKAKRHLLASDGPSQAVGEVKNARLSSDDPVTGSSAEGAPLMEAKAETDSEMYLDALDHDAIFASELSNDTSNEESSGQVPSTLDRLLPTGGDVSGTSVRLRMRGAGSLSPLTSTIVHQQRGRSYSIRSVTSENIQNDVCIEGSSIRPFSVARCSAFDGLIDHCQPLRYLGCVGVLMTLPTRLLIIISIPVVSTKSDTNKVEWLRPLASVNMLFSLPLILIVFQEDAFYGKPVFIDGVPDVLAALVVSFVLAATVYFTTTPDHPPKFLISLAYFGFLLSLTMVYFFSNELIAVIRAFGIWFGLSPSVVGSLAIGIGNGLSDLVANFVVARNGWPKVALAAVYGSIVMNLLIGIGISGFVGIAKFGTPEKSYPIVFDIQLVAVLSFLTAAFGLLFFFLFRRNAGLGSAASAYLFVLYVSFFVTSVIFEALGTTIG